MNHGTGLSGRTPKKKGTDMNIYDYAMDIEKEGERIYREFAENASSEELRTVFNWLAEADGKAAL